MMWILQYVKGGVTLVDMVVDGRLIFKLACEGHGMLVLPEFIRPGVAFSCVFI
jgi:hypothetical protein